MVDRVLARIEVVDTPQVHDAIELARSSSKPYLFNHARRSWLFAVLIAERAKPAPQPKLLAVSAILHDVGLTDRRYVKGYTAPTFADFLENALFTE